MTAVAIRAAAAAPLMVAPATTAYADSSRATAPATANDRAAVESCLKLVAGQAAAQSKRSEVPHAARGAAAQLDGAAADAKSDPASCIGIVTNPCEEEPGGYSTPAMMACNERELAVWEERLDRLYRAAVKSGGKEADAVRRAEQAWVALRDARCALPAIQEEGGTAVGPLETACQLEETARQAIWLESLV